METLPIELLQAIWGELCTWTLSDPSRETFEESECYSRSLLPGRLAAVCRHWRHVALNTPELWTCIVLPSNMASRPTEPLLDHVTLQLVRSRTLPLELVLVEESRVWDVPGEVCAKLGAVLHIAVQHAWRWRSAKLRLSSRHGVALFCGLLHGRPTPLLEEFHVDAPDDGPFDASWLSAASSLTTIGARGGRLYVPQTHRLSTVVSAHIDVDVMDLNHLWCSLCALPVLRSLSLRQLLIGALNFFGPATPKPTLSFLETLKLRGSFVTLAHFLAPTLTAPRLKRLNIETSAVDECLPGEWCPEFFAAFPTIVELVLVADGAFITHAQGCCGGVTCASRLSALSQLEQLKSVTFIGIRFPARSTEPNRHCGLFVVLDTDGPTAVHDLSVCQAAACPPPALVWPQLESITLRDVDLRDAGVELLTDLLCFSRTRAHAYAVRGKRISLRIFDWPARFPSWFREAVGCTLGPAHVHLRTSDGAVHAPVADDAEEEQEEEAFFTDSDTGSEISSSGTEYDSDDVYSDDEDEWTPR